MRFLTADSIFNGTKFLDKETVLAIDDESRLIGITDTTQVEPGKTEYYKGILCPGFINAHCHLELSHMKETIPAHKGFIEFAKQIITARNKVELTQRVQAMQQADTEMYESGIVAVGDICNTAESLAVKQNSRMYYHSFVELLGLHPEKAQHCINEGETIYHQYRAAGLAASLAPHAPYSTSLQLIEQIAAFNAKKKLPLSIHNQESPEENKFFEGQAGGFQNLYHFLGLDISWYQAPGCSSIRAFGPLIKQQHSILVHNSCTSAEEIQEIKAGHIYWCLCPLSNLYIESQLPEFLKFATVKNNLCIGTDSLASNTRLNVLDEAKELLKFPGHFSVEEILRMLNSQGARALGIENEFGHLIPGKNTGLNLVAQTSKGLDLIKKIC